MFSNELLKFAQVQADNSGLSIGVLSVTAVVIAIPLALIVVWLKVDYQRHKRPLQEIDPSVQYSFWHHVKVVTIPLLSYRISFYVSKRDTSVKPPSNPQA